MEKQNPVPKNRKPLQLISDRVPDKEEATALEDRIATKGVCLPWCYRQHKKISIAHHLCTTTQDHIWHWGTFM